MSYESEYVCPSCGSLLIHSNPLTLESMKDVHNQHCVVMRQKSIAMQVARRPSVVGSVPSVTAATIPRITIAAGGAALLLLLLLLLQVLLIQLYRLVGPELVILKLKVQLILISNQRGRRLALSKE